MRPIRLELEGFGSYRQHTVLDLSDVDLFALVGPTGSGKSTLLDAIVFALYGRVPRYDARTVGAVVSRGADTARIRLEFTVGGQRCEVVRVVRGGAAEARRSTREARLEVDGAVVAGSVRELDERIPALIGLTYEQFTRAVLLPQGQFAAFLHATPGERGDLLKALLDLDIYDRVAERARQRARGAEAELTLLRDELERSAVSEEALTEAAARAARLRDLAHRTEQTTQELTGLDREVHDAAEHRRRLADARTRLAQIHTPADLEELQGRAHELDTQLAEATAERDRVAEELEAAEQTLAAAPQAADLRTLLDLLDRHAGLAQRLAGAETALREAEQALARARAEVDTAEEAVRSARATREELHRRHLAVALAATLEVGAPCPVCTRTVEVLPDHPVPEGLDTAEQAVADAEAQLRHAQQALRAAERQQGTAAGQLQTLRQELEAVTVELGAAQQRGLPTDREAVVAALEQAAARERTVEELRRRRRELDQQVRGLEQQRAALTEAITAAWQRFDQRRDAVAELGPPPVARTATVDALVVAWQQLTTWAAEQQATIAEQLAALEERLAELDRRREALTADLRRALAEAEVPVAEDPTGWLAAVQRALAAAEQHREQLEERRARAEELAQRIADRERVRRLAHELGRLLDARHFQAWLLNRALRRLEQVGSRWLQQLTGGAYSLALTDDNQFDVVDHLNADLRRPARSLSGGETFLASLALALALAEDVAALSTRGATRLESLFLDEGFGTLDPDTLDTVAATLEELGSGDRMVGVVTHVRELAERLPVRFEVRRQGRSSVVERVEAGA